MSGLPRLFSFQGRINRKAYIISVCTGAGISFACFFLFTLILEVTDLAPSNEFVAAQGFSFLLINIPLFIFALAAQARRLHDLNRPGWHAVMDFIPLLNIYFNFQLLLQQGTNGPNQYGPDPLDTSAYAPSGDSPDAFAISAALHEKNGELALARLDYEKFLELAGPSHPARPVVEKRLDALPK